MDGCCGIYRNAGGLGCVGGGMLGSQHIAAGKQPVLPLCGAVEHFRRGAAAAAVWPSWGFVVLSLSVGAASLDNPIFATDASALRGSFRPLPAACCPEPPTPHTLCSVSDRALLFLVPPQPAHARNKAASPRNNPTTLTMAVLERTLALIKPDAVASADAILDEAKANGFVVLEVRAPGTGGWGGRKAARSLLDLVVCPGAGSLGVAAARTAGLHACQPAQSPWAAPCTASLRLEHPGTAAVGATPSAMFQDYPQTLASPSLSPLHPATPRASYAGAGQRVLLGAFWQDLLLQPGYLHEQVWRRARAPSCCPWETVLNPKPLMSHSDCSGPLVAAILAKQNAVQDWRKLIGPTDANQAREEAPDRSVGRRKTVQRLGWKEGFSEVALLAVSCLLPPPSPSACAPAMAQTSSAMPCTAATRWPAPSARRTFSSRIVCCPALLFLLSQTPPSEPPAIPQL